jgi:MinD-like ATPase involved in chromosome partitioning or flagellar assembly
MSNDGRSGTDGQTGWAEPQVDDSVGLPGYQANNKVPGGFELPVPAPGSDPWSGTWDTDSSGDHWETGGTAADGGSASGNGWHGHDDTSTIQLPAVDHAGWRPAGSPEPEASSTHHAADHHAGDHGGGGHYDTSDYTPGLYDTTGQHHADHGTVEHGTVEHGTADHAHEESAHGADPAAYASDPAPAGPHADDLMTARSKGQRQKVKASSGLRRAFGLGPGRAEMLERDRIERIARPVNGRKTIMVINTKGGGGKTLVTLMLASYLGRYRSGSVLAWDNNETEGTLGMRAPSQSHHRTVVDLLGALPQIAEDPNAGTSELEHWVREQRGLNFDVLASADDDEAMRIVGEQEFEDLHTQLSRFYRMIVVDTGNNRLAPNWLAAASHADLLVFATSLKDDTSVVAAKNLDALVAMGRQDLVRNAVCVISHTSAKGDLGAGVHTREHFEQWVRAVVDIPYDPALAPGLHLDPTKIQKRTDDACLEMAASVVDGL